MLNNNSNYQL